MHCPSFTCQSSFPIDQGSVRAKRPKPKQIPSLPGNRTPNCRPVSLSTKPSKHYRGIAIQHIELEEDLFVDTA
jgi:hypothetical protein